MDSLQVPVQPHVLKYLHFHLGEHYFLSVGDQFGLLLFHSLRRPLHDARRDHLLTDYTSRWHVHLGPYGKGRGFHPLTGKTVYELNKIVNDLVHEKMHEYVELAIDHGQQAKFAIEGYMLKYGFQDEDIQFDTLQKSWQRYWAERKKRKRPVASLTGLLNLKDLQKQAKKVPLPTQAAT
ncbi:MAG: hypothetical protein ACRYFX_19705 [Janthinobacterium lividum]